MQQQLERLNDWWRLDLDALAVSRLSTFAQFLGTDGVAGGGIGPAEVPRLFDRHIADSLAFVAALRDFAAERAVVGADEAIRVVDIGSGVGLPGIPVAIARPTWSVTLLDRSQRRMDLASRAVRMCGVTNVTTVVDDIDQVEGRWDVAMLRASLPLGQVLSTLGSIVRSGGQALYAVSRRQEPPDLPAIQDAESLGWRVELLDPADGMLDSPAWLLRMTSP